MPPKKTTIEAVAPSHVTVFPNRHFPFPFTAPRMGDLPFSCLPPTAWESSAWEPTGFQCRSPPPNPWLPPHATNTPSDGTCKQHVNHLETAATLIPRHHHQHRNLCCGQLLRQQTRHQGDLENCLVLFTHIENHGDGTRTPTNPKAGPGGGVRVAWEESECSTCVFLDFFYSCFCMDGGRPPSCFSRSLDVVAVSCLGGAGHGESSPELGGPVALSALLTPSMARGAPRRLRSARVT